MFEITTYMVAQARHEERVRRAEQRIRVMAARADGPLRNRATPARAWPRGCGRSSCNGRRSRPWTTDC
ncbi:MAG: hypothetical protein U0531_01600 [Dehalococcoidia bacterium]